LAAERDTLAVVELLACAVNSTMEQSKNEGRYIASLREPRRIFSVYSTLQGILDEVKGNRPPTAPGLPSHPTVRNQYLMTYLPPSHT
jgi:hypothetical protein